jgi:hypothetical protein
MFNIWLLLRINAIGFLPVPVLLGLRPCPITPVHVSGPYLRVIFKSFASFPSEATKSALLDSTLLSFIEPNSSLQTKSMASTIVDLPVPFSPNIMTTGFDISKSIVALFVAPLKTPGY